MGAPNYVLELNATKETTIARYLRKEGLEALNPEDEEETARIT